MPDLENEDKRNMEPTSQDKDGPESIAARYEILSILGQGGMGLVYTAEDTRLDRVVAVKTILAHRLIGEESSRRFSREARALARLNHSNILTIHDYGQDGDLYYLVMELGGKDLGQILASSEGPVSIDRVKHVGLSVGRALEYAHSHGIVHRDLKPGNILIGTGEEPGWGAAIASTPVKVMDFGLAKVAGTSAITGVSQQLGTPQYMSPEQIAGRDADVESDLYSLGILLYELSTGVRPFDGADVQSILSQHLTMAPVPPSVFNDSIPQALEILILHLLEKDPAKRPGSAREVLETLEGITTAPASTSTDSGPGITGIYGRTFVGRENELAQLKSAFDAAMAGRGALAFVVGEPGIGKTSFCEQLANYVALRGGRTLVGHCYEEGSLSLPYLPFIEIIRSQIESRSDDELRRELGTGAQDVARIVSEVRERLQIDLRSATSPEEDRYRLLQAVSDLLKNIAATKPLLLVLEDLHDSDKGTLEMLTHVARNLAGARLLIVGTYRDVEVNRSHPLSGSLAELRRVANFIRIALRGLTGEEVQKMLSMASEQEVSWGLAEAVHRQTEGNPLFVQEVLRYMVEEGLITREEGRWRATGNTPLAMIIPEGLRDVIGKRLSHLSTETNRLLSLASVIGRDFNLQVLQKVANVSEDDLDQALGEATAAAVLEERTAAGVGATYRFSHAFFRQTLYEEMIASRRLRTHQRVGRALEEIYSRRLDEHAAELAEHFGQSTDADDLEKAVMYGEQAANRAVAVYAYGEAVRLLEQAIQVQDVLGPDDGIKKCELLLVLGNALILGGNPGRYLETEGPNALALAERAGDRSRAGSACELALLALLSYSGGLAFRTEEAKRWAKLADKYAEPGTVGRVWADLLLGRTVFHAGISALWAPIMENGSSNSLSGAIKVAGTACAEGINLMEKGLQLAVELDDPESLWMAAYSWLFYALNNGTLSDYSQKATGLVERLLGQPRDGVRTPAIGGVLLSVVHYYLELGDRERAENVWLDHKELAKSSQQSDTLMNSMALEAELAVFDGRLEESEEIRQSILAYGKEHGVLERARALVPMGMRASLYLGKPANAIPNTANPLLKNLFSIHAGDPHETRSMVNVFALDRSTAASIEGNDSETYFNTQWVFLLELAILVGKQQAIERLVDLCKTTDHNTTGYQARTAIHRHLGEAFAFLGRPEKARFHFHEALEYVTKVRFRPEIALTRFQLAELLLEHYPAERAEALEHLDFAIAEFREMKMQPSLEKALALKQSQVSGS